MVGIFAISVGEEVRFSIGGLPMSHRVVLPVSLSRLYAPDSDSGWCCCCCLVVVLFGFVSVVVSGSVVLLPY